MDINHKEAGRMTPQWEQVAKARRMGAYHASVALSLGNVDEAVGILEAVCQGAWDDSEFDDEYPWEEPERNTVGCPKCGSTDAIRVAASAVGSVYITLGGDHVDEVEWGVLEDVDISQALAYDCRACGHYQEVNGDNGLYEALNLKFN